MLSYDDFSKLDLRVAEILKAEPVNGSEKLLKLLIKMDEETRTLVAGIAKTYSPETLQGKQIVVVANLEPRKLMDIESQGMLLACDSENGPVILTPEKMVKTGSKIK